MRRFPLPGAVLLALVSLTAACGSACKSACDCPDGPATKSCAGEVSCQSGSCVYVCKTSCESLPYTCAANESCNGHICSERVGCK